MTKFINVTDVRTQISTIIESTNNGDQFVLLKNGRPIAGLLKYEDFELFQKFQEHNKKQKFAKAFKNISDKAEELGIGDRWLDQKGVKREDLSDDELLDLIANE